MTCDKDETIRTLSYKLRQKEIEAEKLLQQLKPFLDYRLQFNHPGVGQALRLLVETYPPLLHELTLQPEPDPSDLREAVLAITQDICNDAVTLKKQLTNETHEDKQSYLHMCRKISSGFLWNIQRLQSEYPEWEAAWNKKRNEGLDESFFTLGYADKASLQFLEKMWDEHVEPRVHVALKLRTKPLLCESSRAVDHHLKAVQRFSKELPSLLKPRDRDLVHKLRLSAVESLLKTYNEFSEKIATAISGDIVGIDGSIAAIKSAMKAESAVVTISRTEVEQTRVAAAELLLKADEAREEKETELRVATQTFAAKRAEFDEEKKEIMQNLEAALGRLENLQERERSAVLLCKTRNAELSEMDKILIAPIAISKHLSVTVESKIAEKQNQVDFLDKSCEWVVALLQSLKRGQVAGRSSLVQELYRQDGRMKAIIKVGLHHIQSLIDYKQYLACTGDPTELATTSSSAGDKATDPPATEASVSSSSAYAKTNAKYEGLESVANKIEHDITQLKKHKKDMEELLSSRASYKDIIKAASDTGADKYDERADGDTSASMLLIDDKEDADEWVQNFFYSNTILTPKLPSLPLETLSASWECPRSVIGVGEKDSFIDTQTQESESVCSEDSIRLRWHDAGTSSVDGSYQDISIGDASFQELKGVGAAEPQS